MTALNFAAPTNVSYYVSADAIAPSDSKLFVRTALYEPVDEQAVSKRTPAVISLHGPKERIKVRFRLLRRLPANHDNEGASAPNVKTFDAAIAFIDRMRSHPEFFATLDDDGSAVIEFESSNFFGDITFAEDGSVECYVRPITSPSALIEGDLDSSDIKSFLENSFGVIV